MVQIINSTNNVFVIIASNHNVAQSDKLHTSHIYILAGFTLNQRNAINDQTIVIHNVDNKNLHWSKVIYVYIQYEKSNNHQANQSNQSVIFTLFAEEIITIINSGIK